jgi:hypothetical protein
MGAMFPGAPGFTALQEIYPHRVTPGSSFVCLDDPDKLWEGDVESLKIPYMNFNDEHKWYFGFQEFGSLNKGTIIVVFFGS